VLDIRFRLGERPTFGGDVAVVEAEPGDAELGDEFEGRVELCLDMLRQEIDDAAIVTGGGDVGRWFIGNGRKSADVRFLWIGPMRPEAGDEHGLGRVGRELQHDVLL